VRSRNRIPPSVPTTMRSTARAAQVGVPAVPDVSRILVTGATGFAGSHLVARLPEAAAIVAWAGPSGRRGHTISNPATRAIEWRSVDLLDRRAVTEAIADA